MQWQTNDARLAPTNSRIIKSRENKTGNLLEIERAMLDRGHKTHRIELRYYMARVRENRLL